MIKEYLGKINEHIQITILPKETFLFRKSMMRNLWQWSWQKGTRKLHPFLLNLLLEMAEETGLKNIENIKRTKN